MREMDFRRKAALVVLLGLPWPLLSGNSSLSAFNPDRIEVLTNADLDVIYHTLAHLNLPGDAFNLFSERYIREIRQAKEDLEVGSTRLDQEAASLERRYRQYPRLRFLSQAPFMADDLSSFKQALAMIDYDFRTQTIPSVGKGGKRKVPLMFGNSRRLIPLFRNRFQAPQERAFAKQFAGCLDEEHSRFYKIYREARSELDQQGVEWFKNFWKSQGLSILEPWALKSGVKQFKVFLSPVMRKSSLGVPVVRGQTVLFHVLAPLPESRRQAIHSFFFVLHEAVRRSTDSLVVSDAPSGRPDLDSVVMESRKNAAFYAGHLYLKTRFPAFHRYYLNFFLNLSANETSQAAELERLFTRSYPMNEPSRRRVEAFVAGLP